MQTLTAVPYWKRLVSAVPKLVEVDKQYISGVHTAVLSLAYNWGPARTISLIAEPVNSHNYLALANEIEAIPCRIRSLFHRRRREASLIRLSAWKSSPADFAEVAGKLIPFPLTVIPVAEREAVEASIIADIYYNNLT
ncbi:MAG: hypothetical protein AB9882_11910 [Ignavibacteriaceae bacterium]